MNEKECVENLFDSLFPICRSITGPGIQKSLEILSRQIPLEIQSIPSGKQIFDWTVPKEWHINEAYLTGPDGKKYLDFKNSNLHVINFSTPIDRYMQLEELQPHLHSIPELADATPYVTSYYKEKCNIYCCDCYYVTNPVCQY